MDIIHRDIVSSSGFSPSKFLGFKARDIFDAVARSAGWERCEFLKHSSRDWWSVHLVENERTGSHKREGVHPQQHEFIQWCGWCRGPLHDTWFFTLAEHEKALLTECRNKEDASMLLADSALRTMTLVEHHTGFGLFKAGWDGTRSELETFLEWGEMFSLEKLVIKLQLEGFLGLPEAGEELVS